MAGLDADGEVVLFGLGERNIVGGKQRLELHQTCATCQETIVPLGGMPLRCGKRQLTLNPQVIPALIQPAAQTFPARDERLMRDFDGGFARLRVVVESQQAITAKLIQHRAHNLR